MKYREYSNTGIQYFFKKQRPIFQYTDVGRFKRIEYSLVFSPRDELVRWMSLDVTSYYARQSQWKILYRGSERHSSRVLRIE